MNTPPNPGIVLFLLLAAQKLGFRVVGRDASGGEIGIFVDGLSADAFLRLGSNEAGGARWLLEEAGDELVPFYVSSLAYHVLHEGALAEDGTVMYRDRSYRVAATWSRSLQHSVAQALDVATGALA